MNRLLFLCCFIVVANANYFIRSRTHGDVALTEEDIPTYITLSTPPYTSNFHMDRKGMAYEIIEELQNQVTQKYGGDANNYTVLLDRAVGPGQIEEHGGMYGEIMDRRAHWAIGPFPRGHITLNPHKPYQVGEWYKVSLKFIVDRQSPMAMKKKEFDILNQSYHRFELEKVQFIFVEDSAEYLFFNNTRNIIPHLYQEISNWLKTPSNWPILVSNICEGIRLLEDFNDQDVAKEPSKPQPVLVTTDLIASHYIAGNTHLQIMDTSLTKDASDKTFMTYIAISWTFSTRRQQMADTMKRSESKINKLVWKWMQYDENACEKLAKGLKSGVGGGGGGSLGVFVGVFVAVLMRGRVLERC